MEAEFSRIEIIGSMSKVSAFIEMLSSKHIKEIHKLGISGITVYNAMGCGVQSGSSEYMLDFTEQPLRLLPKSTMIMICETSKVKEVIEFLKKEFYTGHIGDEKYLCLTFVILFVSERAKTELTLCRNQR